jgi:hypothetical protein
MNFFLVHPLTVSEAGPDRELSSSIPHNNPAHRLVPPFATKLDTTLFACNLPPVVISPKEKCTVASSENATIL